MLATMPQANTQYLQVPKALPYRKARARSASRPRDAYIPHKPAPSNTEVIVSPVKLSFQHHSPPSTPSTPVRLEIHRSLPPPPPPPTTLTTPSAPAAFTSKSPTDETSTHRPLTANQSSADHAATTVVTLDVASEESNSGSVTQPSTLTPPPALPLRQRLIGTWKLESYIAYPTPQSLIQRQTYPMTKNVTGFIMYTPDGYMAAQMLIPGQKSFKRGESDEAQWAEAGKRCFSYCGPYYITDEGPGREEVLRHTFQYCSLPGWVGDIQVRTHRFEEDGEVLVLGSEDVTEIKGDKRIPVLRWRRARDNAAGVPPPPMPQIQISGPGEL